MTLIDLIYKLTEMQAVHGEDIEVCVTGIYGSSGTIEEVSFNEHANEVEISSDMKLR